MTTLIFARHAGEPQPETSDCPDYQFRWSVTFGADDGEPDDEMPFVTRECAEQFAKAWVAGDDEGVNAAIRNDG